MEPEWLLAQLRAAIDIQIEKLQDGEWDVMKTPELMEDPSSWLVVYLAKAIDKVEKINAATYGEQLRAAVAMMEPVGWIINDLIEQRVPADQKQLVRDEVRDRLRRILLPTGPGASRVRLIRPSAC